MDNINATIFVYRHKSTGEILCLYLDEAGNVPPKDHYHEATLNPKMWVQYWFDAIAHLQAKDNEKVA